MRPLVPHIARRTDTRCDSYKDEKRTANQLHCGCHHSRRHMGLLCRSWSVFSDFLDDETAEIIVTAVLMIVTMISCMLPPSFPRIVAFYGYAYGHACGGQIQTDVSASQLERLRVRFHGKPLPWCLLVKRPLNVSIGQGVPRTSQPSELYRHRPCLLAHRHAGQHALRELAIRR